MIELCSIRFLSVGQTALPDHASKMAVLQRTAGRTLSKVFDYFGIQFLTL